MDLNDYQISDGQLHFWHQARLGLIKFLIKDIKPGSQILSVGCGTGEELAVLQRAGQVLGLDINHQAIDLARQMGFEARFFDISQNIPAQRYDVVCAFDVLEHINNDGRALKNINSCLNPTGYLLITVPAYPWLFSSHDLALKHQRRYSKNDLNKKLKQANFQITKLGYWNSCLFPLIIIIRLLKKIFPPKIAKSEAGNLPVFINHLGLAILKLENYLITKNFKFPFGLSLYVVAKKL